MLSLTGSKAVYGCWFLLEATSSGRKIAQEVNCIDSPLSIGGEEGPSAPAACFALHCSSWPRVVPGEVGVFCRDNKTSEPCHSSTAAWLCCLALGHHGCAKAFPKHSLHLNCLPFAQLSIRGGKEKPLGARLIEAFLLPVLAGFPLLPHCSDECQGSDLKASSWWYSGPTPIWQFLNCCPVTQLGSRGGKGKLAGVSKVCVPSQNQRLPSLWKRQGVVAALPLSSLSIWRGEKLTLCLHKTRVTPVSGRHDSLSPSSIPPCPQQELCRKKMYRYLVSWKKLPWEPFNSGCNHPSICLSILSGNWTFETGSRGIKETCQERQLKPMAPVPVFVGEAYIRSCFCILQRFPRSWKYF